MHSDAQPTPPFQRERIRQILFLLAALGATFILAIAIFASAALSPIIGPDASSFLQRILGCFILAIACAALIRILHMPTLTRQRNPPTDER